MMCGRMRVCWSEEACWRWPGAGGSQNRRPSSSTTRNTGIPDILPLPAPNYLYLIQRISGTSKYQCSAVSSVGDLWYFVTDPDLDPRIRTSGWRIRIRLLSSVTLRMLKKFFSSFFIYFSYNIPRRHIIFSLLSTTLKIFAKILYYIFFC